MSRAGDQNESKPGRSKNPHPGKRLIVGASIFVFTGCGASSARLSVGPMLDSKSNVAIEATFSLGFGMPVDYHQRSRHYVQGLAFIGGGSGVAGVPDFRA